MRFLHAIIRHPELKVTALALAVLLWFHVATNHTYTIEVSYYLDYLNLPPTLALSAPPPPRAVIRVHGTGKHLLRLMWQDRRWPIDLSRATAGPVTVRLDPDMMPMFGLSSLRVDQIINPGEFAVQVDSAGEKSVPIIPAVTLLPPQGHVAVGAAILVPDSARVRGPSGELDRITSVFTRALTLPTGVDNLDLTVDLVPPPGYHVVLTPSQAHLLQRVEAYGRREFTGVTLRPPRGRQHDTWAFLPSVVTVEVGGPQSAMASVTPESISVHPVASADDTAGVHLALEARVHPPLEVLNVVPDSVTLVRHEPFRRHPGD